MSDNKFDMQCLNARLPICILHTRTGCIPHLTQETLAYLDSKLLPNIYQVPIQSVIDYEKTFEAFGSKALECFALPKKSLLYSTVKDHSCLASKGYNTNKSVAVWGSGGKINVTPITYMKLMAVMKPDLFQVLADGDVTPSDSRKRVIKSVNRTVKYLEECLMFHRQSEELKSSKIICMIEGGILLEERKRCVNLIHEKLNEFNVEPWGYVIDSLPSDQLLSSKTKSMIKEIINLLGQDKRVIVHGFGHPVDIIDLIACGISVFGSSYITTLSEKYFALVYVLPKTTTANCEKDERNENSRFSNFTETIDLSDSQHSRSFAPILENCACYTCAHHTRAYIHHLITVNEMLAPVLLMLHNLHHHLMLFSFIRSELENKNSIKTLRETLIKINSDLVDS